MDVAVSYCIVNTEQRELMLRCLDAVARDRAALTVTSEVLVLDNASRDGSAGAARAHPVVDELIRLGLHRRFVVQSRGERTRTVDWSQSAALLVRRDAAEAIGWFDPAFFVYSDEVDFCKRLQDGGWSVLFAPAAHALHHEAAGAPGERRIVELSRNRDRYVRKHHGPAAALAVRGLTAWTYAVRSVLALAVPGHDARRYRRHVTATLFPGRGEGLAEAAADFNRGPRL